MWEISSSEGDYGWRRLALENLVQADDKKMSMEHFKALFEADVPSTADLIQLWPFTTVLPRIFRSGSTLLFVYILPTFPSCLTLKFFYLSFMIFLLNRLLQLKRKKELRDQQCKSATCTANQCKCRLVATLLAFWLGSPCPRSVSGL